MHWYVYISFDSVYIIIILYKVAYASNARVKKINVDEPLHCT